MLKYIHLILRQKNKVMFLQQYLDLDVSALDARCAYVINWPRDLVTALVEVPPFIKLFIIWSPN